MEVLNSLEDIVRNIEIESNFCIRHRDYQPFALDAQTVARFEQLPDELQQKYLSLLLRNLLYGLYYNGSLRKALTSDPDSANLALQQNLENNTLYGVNLGFYDRLHASNQGEGYFDPSWQLLRQEADGSLAVAKGGLTLYITRESHLQSSDRDASIGDLVAIRMPKNRVQNGFYVAIGDEGQEKQGHRQTARIYFNVDPEGAVAVMNGLTRSLNQAAIPFTLKLLYNPSEYGRYDAGVLYFEKSDYEAIRPVLETVLAEGRSHFGEEVPLFSKWLAPGLALAEEPHRKFATRESFGMNRCRMVAQGLLEAWQSGNHSREERMNAILHRFSQLGIDWQRAYLNPDSEDIYTPLLDTLSSPIK